MPVVELLSCCPMNEILTCCKTFLSPCDCMIPPLACHLHFPHVICTYMYVCCHCDKCKGKLVPLQIMWKHCQAELKNQTVSEQNEWKCLASSAEPIADLCRFPIYSHNTPPVLHLTNPSTASCSPIQQEVLNSGTNTSANINFFLSHMSGPIQLHFEPTKYPLIEEPPEPLLYKDSLEDLLDLRKDQADNPEHEDDISAYAGPFHSEPSEDEPDPFIVKFDNSMPSTSGIQREPDHLLVIYVIVAWLHMQFLLPHVACNVLLAFLACLLMFLIPGIWPPFITLHSTTHTLSINPQIILLSVCPNC